jgi:hypothetical protein
MPAWPQFPYNAGMASPHADLPGADLVDQGLADLAAGRETVAALLVAIGAPRLTLLGIPVPAGVAHPEHRLYGPARARGRRLRARALQRPHPAAGELRAGTRVRELADEGRIRELMRALGREAEAPGQVFLTGGATAVLLGFRSSTLDVDIKLVPDQDRVLRAIPRLKESLRVNVELAAPDQFSSRYRRDGPSAVRSSRKKAASAFITTT